VLLGEGAGEAERGILHADAPRDGAAPLPVEGNGGGVVGAVAQAVGEGVVIVDVQVADVHLGRPRLRVDPHGVVREGHRPEHAVGGDAGVEVVGLILERPEVNT
jgi:hypothetical protein